MQEVLFLTINQVHKMFPSISGNMMRARLKAGELPGFYAGSRFYVNVPAFLRLLDVAVD